MLVAARTVVDEYKGEFPRDITKLQKIPGIGPYTAAAIMSFSYGDRHLAWDTNLRRVVGRFFFGTKQAAIDGSYFEGKFTMPRKNLNAALMDFGSALCTARPKCSACPMRSRCQYFREGGAREAGHRKPKTLRQKPGVDWKEAEAVVVLHDKHRIYYSSKQAKYAPFILPPSYNTRAGIKAYFEKNYQLTLAVRPPHEKRVKGGKQQVVVNAQILLGQPSFRIFSAKAMGQVTNW